MFLLPTVWRDQWWAMLRRCCTMVCANGVGLKREFVSGESATDWVSSVVATAILGLWCEDCGLSVSADPCIFGLRHGCLRFWWDLGRLSATGGCYYVVNATAVTFGDFYVGD